MSILSAPYFHDEQAAYDFIEARLWPNGAVCPKCGVIGNSVKLQGKSTRIGVYKCRDCRKPFTVKVGTIFESSHIAMRVWLQAIFLVSSSKKGISSNQLHRMLGITLKAAWFMSHRIREAMKGNAVVLGGKGKIVEADETFWGTETGKVKNKGVAHKMKVMALVERGGNVRSIRIDDLKLSTMQRVLADNVHPETHLMTDDAWQYYQIGKGFAKHSSVKHTLKEYARGKVTTNTIEGFFAIFKRGLVGTYHHIGSQHLERYTAEFDFRYNNRKSLGIEDSQRAENLLRGVVGKRLTYQTITI